MTTISYNLRFDSDFLTEATMRYRRQHGSRRLIIAVKTSAAFLLIALTVWLFVNKSYGVAAFFVPLIFLLAFGHHLDLWWVRRRFQKSPYANEDEDLRVEISDEGFQAKSPKQDTKLTWAVFTKVVHFQDGFLLFQGPHFFNWIPVRLLKDAGQVELLGQLSKARVSKHQIISPTRADQP